MVRRKRLAFLFAVFMVMGIILTACVIKHRDILKFFHPLKYQEQVYKYSKEFEVDPILVFSMIRVESSYNQHALSPKGAKGLMQITDKTGEWAAEKLKIKNFSTSNLFNPDVNIRIGCWYLNSLQKEFDGNILLAITAYNSGSGRVKQWLNDKKLSSTGKFLERIPFDETDNYVKRVLKEYEVLKYIYSPKIPISSAVKYDIR